MLSQIAGYRDPVDVIVDDHQVEVQRVDIHNHQSRSKSSPRE